MAVLGCGMQVTLDLPDDLVRAVETAAAARGQSPAAFVTQVMRAAVAGEAAVGAGPRQPSFSALQVMQAEVARQQAEFDLEMEWLEPDEEA